MMEFLEAWERYVTEHYQPNTIDCEELKEMYHIADIMKDFAEYMQIKEQIHNTIKR